MRMISKCFIFLFFILYTKVMDLSHPNKLKLRNCYIIQKSLLQYVLRIGVFIYNKLKITNYISIH